MPPESKKKKAGKLYLACYDAQSLSTCPIVLEIGSSKKSFRETKEAMDQLVSNMNNLP